MEWKEQGKGVMRRELKFSASAKPWNDRGVGCALTLAEACLRVTRRLDWYGLAHLRLEQIAETDDGMLTVFIRDKRDQSIVGCVIDPKVGTIRLRLSDAC